MCVANEYDIIKFGGRFSSTLCFISTCSTFDRAVMWTAVSTAGPSKCTFLVDLACAQHDELRDTDSKEETDDAHFKI